MTFIVTHGCVFASVKTSLVGCVFVVFSSQHCRILSGGNARLILNDLIRPVRVWGNEGETDRQKVFSLLLFPLHPPLGTHTGNGRLRKGLCSAF